MRKQKNRNLHVILTMINVEEMTVKLSIHIDMSFCHN